MTTPPGATSASTCDCMAHMFLDNENCVCDVGYELVNGLPSECQPGYYKTLPGNFACDSCGPRTTSPYGSASPSDCGCVGNDSYVDSVTGCVCSAGYGYDVYDHGCWPCEYGTYKSSSDLLTCTSCGSFMTTEYTQSTDINDCICSVENMVPSVDKSSCSCDAGYSYIGTCVQCEEGYYNAYPGMGCNYCGDYYTSPIGSTSPDNCTCKNGLVYDDDTAQCQCVAGMRFDEIFVACHQCGYGYYKPSISRDICTYCGNYMTTSEMMSTSFNDCYCYLPNMSYVAELDGCGCNAGYEFINGECVQCQPGYYKDIIGDVTCTYCGLYQTSPPGSTDVSMCMCMDNMQDVGYGCQCDPGYEFVDNTCVECGDFMYKKQVSNELCLPAPSSCGQYDNFGYVKQSSGCYGGQLGDVCELSCDFGFVVDGIISTSQCVYDKVHGTVWTEAAGCIPDDTLQLSLSSSSNNYTCVPPILLNVKFNRISEIVFQSVSVTNCVIANKNYLTGVYASEFSLTLVPNQPTTPSNMSIVVTFAIGAGHSDRLYTTTSSQYRIIFDYCTYLDMTYDCVGVCGGTSVYDSDCGRCAEGSTGRTVGDCSSSSSSSTADSTAFSDLLSSPAGVAATSGTALLAVGGCILLAILFKKKQKVNVVIMMDKDGTVTQTEMETSALVDQSLNTDSESLLPGTVDTSVPDTTVLIPPIATTSGEAKPAEISAQDRAAAVYS